MSNYQVIMVLISALNAIINLISLSNNEKKEIVPPKLLNNRD